MLNPRVGVFLVLPDDDHIHLRVLGSDIGIVAETRPDVGVETERLAGRHIERFKTSTLRGGNRSFEKHLGTPEGFPCGGLDAGRIAPQVNLFTDLNLLDVQPGPAPLQNCQGSFHDFRTDAVASGDRDGGGF